MWNIDGDDLFMNFRLILSDTIREEWDTLVDASTVDEQDRSPEDFQDPDRVHQTPHPGRYSNQVSQDPSIPSDWEVLRTFGHRVVTLARYTMMIPCDDPSITFGESQVKQSIYDAMLVAWRIQFVRSGQSLTSCPLPKLLQFMANEKRFSKSHSKRGGRDEHHDDDDDGGHGDASANHKRKRDEDSDKDSDEDIEDEDSPDEDGNSQTKKGTKQVEHKLVQPDDPCFIHGGHTWRQCHENPRGDDYRPNRGRGDHMHHSRPTGQYHYYQQPHGGEQQGGWQQRYGWQQQPRAQEQYHVQMHDSVARGMDRPRGHVMPAARGRMPFAQGASPRNGAGEPAGERC